MVGGSPRSNPNNTPGLKSERIIKLFEDQKANLWIGTENKGILLLNGEGNLSPVLLPTTNAMPRLMGACEDAGGSVWLNTADAGEEVLTGSLARFRDGRCEGLVSARAECGKVGHHRGFRVGLGWHLYAVGGDKPARWERGARCPHLGGSPASSLPPSLGLLAGERPWRLLAPRGRNESRSHPEGPPR